MRHVGGGRTLALALGAGALLSGSLVAGQPGQLASPSRGERLQPGASVLVSWALDRRLTQGLDEAELVLSLDDGVTYPVRLTGRIAIDESATRWRVPALPSEHARLALRAGDDEEPGTERLLIVSESFSIASSGLMPADDFFPVKGEWRTREALEESPERPGPRDLASPGPAFAFDPLGYWDMDDTGSRNPAAGAARTPGVGTAARCPRHARPASPPPAASDHAKPLPLRL